MSREEREERRARRRAGSAERDSKHQAGGDRPCLLIPPGLELWQPKAGTHRLDIVPYVVGKQNPYCHDEGALYWEVTYWNHPRLGANQDAYCCPAKMRKERCPVCEHRAELEREGKPKDMGDKEWKDLLSTFRPKERQLFLIHLRGQDEEKVMLWDVSNFLFGDMLDKCRKGATEEQPYKRDFDDPEAGAVLNIGLSEDTSGGFKSIKTYNIEFEPRPKGLNPALLDHGYCLDAIPQVPTYEQLKKVFLQMDEPEEKEEHATASTDSASAKEAGLEEGMQVRHRQFGICEIVRIAEDGKTITLEDEDGSKHKGVNPDDVRVVEAKPKPAKDDDWDDEPAPKKTSKFKVGDWGVYKGKVCEITGVTPSEKTCTVKNQEGKSRTGVPWVEVEPAEAPAKPKPAKDDDWDDEPNPQSARTAEKTSASAKTRASDVVKSDQKKTSRSDDDWDDEPPKKVEKTKAKAKPVKDDDWD